MSDRKTSDAAAMVKAFADAPLNAAPPELQMAVGRLWMLTSHLFPNPLPIAAAVGLWCRDRGLEIDDAGKILVDMTHPELMGTFRFPSDLMICLAKDAQAAIDRAKTRRQRETLALEAPKAGVVDVQEAVREKLREWTGKP